MAGGNVVALRDWKRRHSAASRDLRKASIGTAPPDASLNRLARPREASLRPAKRLRRCDAEQSATSASASIDTPAESAQRIIGCCSDMTADISTRNAQSQPEIFPPEISLCDSALVECGMGRRTAQEPREIFLGDWLRLFEKGPVEAAKIAGCSQSYISNISRGARSNINALYLLRLAEWLGVSVDDFFRPVPSQAHIAALAQLSPKGQASILNRRRRKA